MPKHTAYAENEKTLDGRKGIAATRQSTPYCCAQCGSDNLEALSLIYQNGVSHFRLYYYGSGERRSIAAQQAAPPSRKSLFEPCVFYGFGMVLGYVLQEMDPLRGQVHTVDFILPVALALRVGMAALLIWRLVQTVRYNRTIFPLLLQNWWDSYKCRRCGNITVIRQQPRF
jgi:DNA-directed RNA polymerase subunit RPC12/RpoP